MKEKTAVSLAKEYLDSLPEVKTAIQKSTIESIIMGLMVGFAKEYYSQFKSDISDEEIERWAWVYCKMKPPIDIRSLTFKFYAHFLDGALSFRDKINSNKKELLIEFIEWWNNLPDESDDRLFMNSETIERFFNKDC